MTTPDFTITAERIDLDRFSIETTERVDLINRAQATYSRKWASWEAGLHSEQATVRDADASGITRYGILYNDSLQFPYITQRTQAQAVITWLVLDRAETRYLVRFAGGPWLQRAEIGDTINFDPTGSDEFSNALLGLVTSSDNFTILSVDRPEDGTVEVVAVQIRVFSKLLKEDGDALTYEDDGYILL